MDRFSKPIVIIPAYRPSNTLVALAEALIGRGIPRIVIVDDGSGVAYADIFERLAERDQCTVLTLKTNRGKGFALKHGFAFCNENFKKSAGYVTADCDGQHSADDIIRIAEHIANTNGRLVLGVRDFSENGIPARSRIGNRVTSLVFRFLFGRHILDTQTGLRGFSHDMLSAFLELPGDRYEYETNVLIYAVTHGVSVAELPIRTIYKGRTRDEREDRSHFRPLVDSVRIIGALLRDLVGYFLSATLSGIADLAGFYLLSRFVLSSLSLSLRLPLATILARLLSSLVNFSLNAALVFQRRSSRAALRYYTLWAFQLTVSCLATIPLCHLFAELGAIALGKAAVDLGLAILSYRIQRFWVFAPERPRAHRFFGLGFRAARLIAAPFLKRYACRVLPPNVPTVFVCRHLDLRGPLLMARNLPFDVHFWIYHPFLRRKDCFLQYRNVTFPLRDGFRSRPFVSLVLARLGAWLIPPLLDSMHPIPVYRGGASAVRTLRASLRAFEAGHSILLFPDVDYRADRTTPSEIYDGFLNLELLWSRKHNTPLRFVTLSIDDATRTIRAVGEYVFSENAPFEEQKARFSAQIRADLMDANKNI